MASNTTVSKGIRFPKELADQVQEMATAQRRDFTKQVLYMIEVYLENMEHSKSLSASAISET